MFYNLLIFSVYCGEGGIGYYADLRSAPLTALPFCSPQGFDRRSRGADTLKKRRRSRAINNHPIGSTPTLSEQCHTLRKQCRARYGVLVLGLWMGACSQTHIHKNKTDDSRHPFCIVILRRGRDSNPRSLAAQRFSRPPQSTTLPPLQRTKVLHFF